MIETKDLKKLETIAYKSFDERVRQQAEKDNVPTYMARGQLFVEDADFIQRHLRYLVRCACKIRELGLKDV